MNKLQEMHDYLMSKKFPYHSVSVICRNQDLGYHVIFMGNVKSMVAKDVIEHLEINGFTHSFTENISEY